MFQDIKKFVQLANEFKMLFNNMSLSWEEKYFLVFNHPKSIKKMIMKTNIGVDWIDYDDSYQEDVKQYYDAVQLQADSYREYLAELEMNLD